MEKELIKCHCGRICTEPHEQVMKLCFHHIDDIDLEAFTILPLQIKFDFLFKRIEQLQEEIRELKNK